MLRHIMFDRATIENLLDGIPPKSIMTKVIDGKLVIKCLANEIGILPVNNRFELDPDLEIDHLLTSPLGVSLVSPNKLMIYPSAPRKSFQPSAIISITQVPREKRKPKSPPRETVEEAPQTSFLIRREEVEAIDDAPIIVEEKIVEEKLDDMEDRLRQQWNAPSQSAPPSVTEFLHTAPEPDVLSSKQIKKRVSVPISFDPRRALGSRDVEVLIKRRRIFAKS